MAKTRGKLVFKGWKTKTGKIIERRQNLGEEAGWITFGEHEANKFREVVGDPGRMTPQYN